ncbi:hypothetical protein BH10ACI1_BH10ACI1_35160 [soil metagenome]
MIPAKSFNFPIKTERTFVLIYKLKIFSCQIKKLKGSVAVGNNENPFKIKTRYAENVSRPIQNLCKFVLNTSKLKKILHLNLMCGNFSSLKIR